MGEKIQEPDFSNWEEEVPFDSEYADEQTRLDFEAELEIDKREAELKLKDVRLQKTLYLLAHKEKLQKEEAAAKQREHVLKVNQRKLYVKYKSGEKWECAQRAIDHINFLITMIVCLFLFLRILKRRIQLMRVT